MEPSNPLWDQMVGEETAMLMRAAHEAIDSTLLQYRDGAQLPPQALTMQAINDIIFPPIEVYVAKGRGDELRERIENDLGNEGRRRITVHESEWITDTRFAYVFNGQVYK
jgi:hypothetical protein